MLNVLGRSASWCTLGLKGLGLGVLGCDAQQCCVLLPTGILIAALHVVKSCSQLYCSKMATTVSPIPQALYSVTSYFILQIVVSLLPPLQPGWTFSFLRLVYLHFCLIFWGHLLFEVSHHAVKKPKLVHAKRPWREPIYKYLGQLLADVQPTAKVSHQTWKWILLRTI